MNMTVDTSTSANIALFAHRVYCDIKTVGELGREDKKVESESFFYSAKIS